MKRRSFITLLGGAAAAWPLAARAQQAGKLPTVGLLVATTLLVESPRVAAFVQRLRELGWIEGRTVVIEVRYADGRNERFVEIAAEFVRLKVDVIVTQGTASVIAARQAAAVIPIVFAGVADPVSTGLVASLAHPGGNVTGLSNQLIDLVGKRIEILREILPGLRTLAIMANVGNPAPLLEMGEVSTIARTLGLEAAPFEIQRGEDIAPAFDVLKRRADALYVCVDPLLNTNRVRINTLAQGARLPTMYGVREYVEAGGLLSYGPNLVNQSARRRLCRQDSARSKARRPASRAADE